MHVILCLRVTELLYSTCCSMAKSYRMGAIFDLIRFWSAIGTCTPLSRKRRFTTFLSLSMPSLFWKLDSSYGFTKWSFTCRLNFCRGNRFCVQLHGDIQLCIELLKSNSSCSYAAEWLFNPCVANHCLAKILNFVGVTRKDSGTCSDTFRIRLNTIANFQASFTSSFKKRLKQSALNGFWFLSPLLRKLTLSRVGLQHLDNWCCEASQFPERTSVHLFGVRCS